MINATPREIQRQQELVNLENEKLQQDVESKSRELAPILSCLNLIYVSFFTSFCF